MLVSRTKLARTQGCVHAVFRMVFLSIRALWKAPAVCSPSTTQDLSLPIPLYCVTESPLFEVHVCKCTCACVPMHVCLHICTHGCGGLRFQWGVFLNNTLPIFSSVSHCTWSSQLWLHWLARMPRNPPVSTSQHWDYRRDMAANIFMWVVGIQTQGLGLTWWAF